MGLLVSTDLMDSVCAFGGLRMVVLNHRLSILLVGGPVGMWAKASISPLFELAREAGEAEPVGAADRPHIHRRFLSIVSRRDQGFWMMIRGELAIRRGISRHTLHMRGGPVKAPPPDHA